MKKTSKRTHPKSKRLTPKAATASSADDMERTELSGSHNKIESLDASDTDENENEGLGNGKMERSDKDILHK